LNSYLIIYYKTRTYSSRAEAETKAKLEKVAEIKKLNMQIMSIRSDMSKNEDQLKDFQRYREFLEKLTPPEWIQQHQKNKTSRKKKSHLPSAQEGGAAMQGQQQGNNGSEFSSSALRVQFLSAITLIINMVL
jgi:hypothetical protein